MSRFGSLHGRLAGGQAKAFGFESLWGRLNLFGVDRWGAGQGIVVGHHGMGRNVAVDLLWDESHGYPFRRLGHNSWECVTVPFDVPETALARSLCYSSWWGQAEESDWNCRGTG